MATRYCERGRLGGQLRFLRPPFARTGWPPGGAPTQPSHVRRHDLGQHIRHPLRTSRAHLHANTRNALRLRDVMSRGRSTDSPWRNTARHSTGAGRAHQLMVYKELRKEPIRILPQRSAAGMDLSELTTHCVKRLVAIMAGKAAGQPTTRTQPKKRSALGLLLDVNRRGRGRASTTSERAARKRTTCKMFAQGPAWTLPTSPSMNPRPTCWQSRSSGRVAERPPAPHSPARPVPTCYHPAPPPGAAVAYVGCSCRYPALRPVMPGAPLLPRRCPDGYVCGHPGCHPACPVRFHQGSRPLHHHTSQ
ncbi:hypothetical protein Vretifemale_18384 [Volvox reticuliferus]|uniref:Uncharacterized protein n=1 Tax=Volvox reticuliferus TaxID=1737510 RepID=A0A8J4CZ90_9CHLO|nr:hypothetical protein Vretifemale_18384 [Volvox reticuliferus]